MRDADQHRGQAAAIAGAGASASTSFAASRRRSAASCRSRPRTLRPAFFSPRTRAPNPVISSICRGSGGGRRRLSGCYLLPGAVTWGVTGKPLLLHGFKGLLPCYRVSRPLYICASARAHAPIPLSIYGNNGNKVSYCLLSVGYALPSLLLDVDRAVTAVTGGGDAAGQGGGGVGGSGARIKIRGGYSAGPVGRASGADLHPSARPAARKFWERGVFGLAVELGGGVRGGDLGNGGFPPFSDGLQGRVGTVALEWSAQGLDRAAEFGAQRKLSKLQRLANGGDRAERGGTPPNRPRPLLSMRAQPFFRIWIAPSLDRSSGAAGERAPNLIARQGLGVSGFSSASGARGDAPGRSRGCERVGDGRSSAGHSDEPVTLWGGSGHVNG
jgi:hypothetical protein